MKTALNLAPFRILPRTANALALLDWPRWRKHNICLCGNAPRSTLRQLFLRFAQVFLPLVFAGLLVHPNLHVLIHRQTTYSVVVKKLTTALASGMETLISDLLRPSLSLFSDISRL